MKLLKNKEFKKTLMFSTFFQSCTNGFLIEDS